MMKAGDLIRHTGKPEWGVGVVIENVDSKCTIHFEEKGRVVLLLEKAQPFLADVGRNAVQSDSALLDPQRWHSLALPAEQRVKKTRTSTTAARCETCKKPLNRSQYSEGKKLKSCPKCSATDGRQHIFYEYPDAFGQTDARVSDTTPDGAQSYCATCRTNDDPIHGARRCSSVALQR